MYTITVVLLSDYIEFRLNIGKKKTLLGEV